MRLFNRVRIVVNDHATNYRTIRVVERRKYQNMLSNNVSKRYSQSHWENKMECLQLRIKGNLIHIHVADKRFKRPPLNTATFEYDVLSYTINMCCIWSSLNCVKLLTWQPVALDCCWWWTCCCSSSELAVCWCCRCSTTTAYWDRCAQYQAPVCLCIALRGNVWLLCAITPLLMMFWIDQGHVGVDLDSSTPQRWHTAMWPNTILHGQICGWLPLPLPVSPPSWRRRSAALCSRCHPLQNAFIRLIHFRSYERNCPGRVKWGGDSSHSGSKHDNGWKVHYISIII